MGIGRSENMRRIRSKDTGPELVVRTLLRQMGFLGYRLHRKELPGKPDIAFISKRKAILIHGCFWHRHDCKEGQRKPKSNLDYWLPKIERNCQRDSVHLEALLSLGWTVMVIWECELRDVAKLEDQLRLFLSPTT